MVLMQMHLRGFSQQTIPALFQGRSGSETCNLTAAKDIHLFTDQGRRMLDATAGNWRTNLGHADPYVSESIRWAVNLPLADRLDGQFRDLRDRLTRFVGPPCQLVFAESESHALIKALKIAAAYHRARKQGGRSLVIAANRSLGTGGRVRLVCESFPENSFLVAGRTVAEIEDLIALHGAESIAALLIEPLGAWAGLTVPTRDFCRAVSTLCAQHGILIICDESLSGFGRLGAATAAQRLGIAADILVLGDGLTNGELPLGAVLCREKIAAALHDAGSVRRAATSAAIGLDWRPDRATVAAALGTMLRHEELDLVGRVRELESYWSDCLESLAEAPMVTAVRSFGLAGAIELAPRPGTVGSRGQRLFQRCMEHGLLIDLRDDTALLAPPLIVTQDQIDDVIEKLSAGLRKLA
jgi:beta-alanine--pyruvate transaminase